MIASICACVILVTSLKLPSSWTVQPAWGIPGAHATHEMLFVSHALIACRVAQNDETWSGDLCTAASG